MITFEDRTGPRPDVVYQARQVPGWWQDAKFGIFLHWGIYSVPAWATPDPFDCRTELDEYTHHRYAEWYGNTVRIEGSPTHEYHCAHYGERSYEDLLDLWHAERFDATALVDRLADWGARYVVPTSKHHDGCCLWASGTTDFNTVGRGPRRDLMAEFSDAARARGLRFGAYYSGALDWHQGHFPPITSNRELFAFRRNDPEFAGLCATQLTELVDRFRPDILWNDIEWPDGGKGEDPHSLAALFGHYFDVVPDGVVNDRWGVPFHGFLTREYREIGVESEPWEATRGVGRSFGYNRAEDPEFTLSGAEAIRLLVRTVAAGGNLLLNVGLTAAGEVPPEQAAVLDQLGAWLRAHGDAVYGTRALQAESGDGPVVTTRGQDGTMHAFVLDPGQPAPLPEHLVGATILTADGTRVAVDADGLALPAALRSEPVAVLKVVWS